MLNNKKVGFILSNLFYYSIMNNLPPPEIWQIVLDYSDFLTKIRIRQICKELYIHLRIIDFYHIEDQFLIKLNDDIIKQHPYIKYLFAFDNSNITDINHLEHLEVLDASWECGIHSQGLKNITSLKVLDVNGNPRVKKINQMTKLEKLHAKSICGIGNEDIKDLKLKYLDAEMNNKITIII